MTLLTAAQQIALRRVANRLSEVDFVRLQDFERLRALDLIDQNKRAPALTGEGRRQHDRLPKAVVVVA